MDTFGDRLEHERQDRGLTIQAVAEALRFDEEYLRALERNDFGALPDEAAMTECLHGYAKLLEVDADLMIEDYLEERDKHLRGLEEGTGAPSADAMAVAVESEPEGRRRISAGLTALVVLAILVLAVWWVSSRDSTSPPSESAAAPAPVEAEPKAETAPVAEPPAAGSAVDEALSTTMPPEAATSPEEAAAASAEPAPVPDDARPAEGPQTPPDTPIAPAEPSPQRSSSEPRPPSSLTVADYGVGTAVENRRLVGRGDSFPEQSRVCFWTHVEGGAPGDRIDHVWFMEGQEVTRRSLEIGGPSWRTYTAKTIDGGVGSEWVVEAHDSAGRVLARSEFFSSP